MSTLRRLYNGLRYGTATGPVVKRQRLDDGSIEVTVSGCSPRKMRQLAEADLAAVRAEREQNVFSGSDEEFLASLDDEDHP